MSIIISEAAPSLEDLQDQYDRARTEADREHIAAEVYELAGGKVKGMIQHRAKGLRLDPDQLHALAWEALMRGLSESGMTRFKLSDSQHADWQPAIQAMLEASKRGATDPQSRVWSLLSPETRSAVLQNSVYIKTNVQNAVIAEVNGLLRRPGLYDPAAWSGNQLPDEANGLLKRGIGDLSVTELSRLNAQLIASAFPGLTVPPPPTRNLLGYISATIVPKLQPQMYEAATGRRSESYLVEALAFLRPDIEAVWQMEAAGILPEGWERLSPAQRIYQHQKQRLAARYNPILAWYEARIRELQPQRPFLVNSAGALKDARALLEQHPDRAPASLWKAKNAPYYVPTQALQPIGVKVIERLLATENIGRSAPAAEQSVRPSLSTERPADVGVQTLLTGGHAAPAFRYLVQRIFSPGQAEHSIGMFLAQNPSPSRTQVEQFVASLPDDIADDIETTGWHRTVYEIDSRILDAIKHPQTRAEVVRALGGQPQAVVAALDRARCNIFIRTADFILKAA